MEYSCILIALLYIIYVDYFRRNVDWSVPNCNPNDTSPVPANRVDTSDRLKKLRKVMAKYELDAYIIPLDEEARLPWISGFTGSNAKVVVTRRPSQSKVS